MQLGIFSPHAACGNWRQKSLHGVSLPAEARSEYAAFEAFKVPLWINFCNILRLFWWGGAREREKPRRRSCWWVRHVRSNLIIFHWFVSLRRLKISPAPFISNIILSLYIQTASEAKFIQQSRRAEQSITQLLPFVLARAPAANISITFATATETKFPLAFMFNF